MSNLTSTEKLKLEKQFGMSGGYVLDFSNRTFAEFILENTGLDIDSSDYDYLSNSKANRLREFWKKESNYIVGNLILSMLEMWRTKKMTNSFATEITRQEELLCEECNKIAQRLKQESSVTELDAIQPNNEDKDFSVLANSIKESIQKNQPEVALDRLHTFTTKYVRQLCNIHGVQHDRDTPLHSLLGGYIKFLKNSNIIESQMTEKILKSSISVFDAFNDVRNNKSFAHDNPILNYEESILIFNHISNVIKFVEIIENKQTQTKEKVSEVFSTNEDFQF